MPDIVFNIIYTPGSVAPLTFMMRSLLHWSNCSFRLVSNGCFPMEQSQLRSMCAANPRLEYYALPTQIPWQHGLALDFLRILSPGEHFGFLDSDIFACGEFMSDVMNARAQNAAVFSGVQVWTNTADQIFESDFYNLAGRYYMSDQGATLGCTYFALYDARLLDDLLQRTPMSFLNCGWREVPTEYRKAIRQTYSKVRTFDTTKLINLTLAIQGARLEYVNLPNLIHIGGITLGNTLSNTRQKRSFLSYFERIQHAMRQRQLQRSISAREAKKQTNMLKMRPMMSRYFWDLLNALSSRSPLPDLPDIADEEVRSNAHATTKKLIEAHQQFGD